MKRYNYILLLFVSLILFNCQDDEEDDSTQNEITQNINSEERFTGLSPKPNNYNEIPSMSISTTGEYRTSYFLDLPPAGNQKKQGSSTAWAVAYGMQSYFRKEAFNLSSYNDNTYCSPSFIFNQVNKYDCASGGISIIEALEVLKNQGVCTMESMPYDFNNCSTRPTTQQINNAYENKISHYESVPLNTNAFKSALINGHPIVIGVHLNKAFKKEKFRQINNHFIWNGNDKTTYAGYHAMVVSGYDDNLNAIKVLNSWGKNWGEDGYIWISYDMIGKRIDEALIAYNRNNNQNNTSTRVLNLSGNLAFGTVNVGSYSNRTLTITNTGTSTLTVTNITLPTGFSVTNGKSFNLGAGQSRSVNIRFQPEEIEYYSGNITVYSNKTSGINTKSINGTGYQNNTSTRILNLSGNLDFGTVNIKSYSNKTLTVTNTGTSTLTVTNIILPTGFSVTNGTSFNLGAGQVRSVNIRFQPTQASLYSGNITVYSNKTSGTNTRSINGTGYQTPTRVLNLSGNFAFGTINVGSFANKTLTVKNTGNSTLTITNITLPTGFSVTNGKSFNLAAGQSRSVNIRFQPTKNGSYSGNIFISSNKTSGNYYVSVSGTGYDNSPTRILNLSGNFAFGTVNVGNMSNKILVISNTGNSTLTVTNIILPSGFSVTNGTSFNLSPGQSRTVGIRFQPNKSGSYNGNITVYSNKTSGTSYMSVSGTGYQEAPTRILGLYGYLSYGNVKFTGSYSDQTLIIRNSGNSTLSVTNIILPTGFSVTNGTSFTINPGGQRSVMIRFKPTQSGLYSGNVIIYSNKTDGTSTKKIDGYGIW